MELIKWYVQVMSVTTEYEHSCFYTEAMPYVLGKSYITRISKLSFKENIRT
jgi:hypothetical protein